MLLMLFALVCQPHVLDVPFALMASVICGKRPCQPAHMAASRCSICHISERACQVVEVQQLNDCITDYRKRRVYGCLLSLPCCMNLMFQKSQLQKQLQPCDPCQLGLQQTSAPGWPQTGKLCLQGAHGIYTLYKRCLSPIGFTGSDVKGEWWGPDTQWM